MGIVGGGLQRGAQGRIVGRGSLGENSSIGHWPQGSLRYHLAAQHVPTLSLTTQVLVRVLLWGQHRV